MNQTTNHAVDVDNVSVGCPHCKRTVTLPFGQAGPCKCPLCSKVFTFDPAVVATEQLVPTVRTHYWPEGSGVTSRRATFHCPKVAEDTRIHASA